MWRYLRFKAGTWSVPDPDSKFVFLVRFIAKLKKGEWPFDGNPVTKAFSLVLGDDKLFDDLDRLGKEYLDMCADYIMKRMVDEFDEF